MSSGILRLSRVHQLDSLALDEELIDTFGGEELWEAFELLDVYRAALILVH